jgi:hypothetical protein
MKNGNTTPIITSTKPIRIIFTGLRDIILLVKPASHEMPWFRFKFRWEFYFTETLDPLGTARVEPAARGRIDQAGRLARG